MIQDQARQTRRRRRLVLALLAVALLGVAFLPGPNGLVSVVLKSLQARRLRREIPRLEARIDTLERVCRYLSDPTFAGEFAARRLAAPLADSTVPVTPRQSPAAAPAAGQSAGGQ